MHEQKSVQFVVEQLEQSGAKKAKLKLGLMVANPKTFKEIYDLQVRGTSLENVKLEIESIPIEVKCPKCGFEGTVAIIEHVHFIKCPQCNEIADIIHGDELELIENIE
ncbi:MAG: hydrogenase maturation nickel metallochaperone HypA [Nanoarchaeota archaeon]|nr:hydrogenase maturation nickel metallochaperone HypA [Nanoarchaeota archaeon]